MRAVGLKVLKNKLSEYVRLVASDEMILVTDREGVVAELGPPGTARSQAIADAVVAELDAILNWLEDTRAERL